jgi:nucleoside-diphosphate-sugar epimerase
MSNLNPTVIVTGVSGNLGMRLLPMLSNYNVVGVDLHPPATNLPLQFESMNLGEESFTQQFTELVRDTRASAIVHLAFVIDPVRTGVTDAEQMWQINVGGTARVLESVSIVNRYVGTVSKFIFPSSVSVYGPDTPGQVKEDAPLLAHTLPYAIHKRECDECVQLRAESLGECSTYILRPHIFTGASMQNYLVGALRGTPTGTSTRAQRMREQGKRLPLMLPYGDKYLHKEFQFLHVDDSARLIVHLLKRQETGHKLTILNVAGRGAPITIEHAAQIGNSKIQRVPTEGIARAILRLLWKWKITAIPPEALPYIIGSYTMDCTRLQQFLGTDYKDVIRYTVEEALADSFRQPDQANISAEAATK